MILLRRPAMTGRDMSRFRGTAGPDGKSHVLVPRNRVETCSFLSRRTRLLAREAEAQAGVRSERSRLKLGDVDEADARLVGRVLAPGHVALRAVPVLAADLELVTVVEANRLREPVVTLPVELPAADREQHLALARRAHER